MSIATVCGIVFALSLQPFASVLDPIDQSNAFPRDFLIFDWERQDSISYHGYQAVAERIKSSLNSIPSEVRQAYDNASSGNASEDTWKEAYILLCAVRRQELLSRYSTELERVAYTKRDLDQREGFPHNIRDREANGLHLLRVGSDFTCATEHLYGDKVARDVCVSFDGKRMLFAHGDRDRKAIMEWDIEADSFRNITSGQYNDMCATYLPSGDIIFMSDRGQLVIPCNGGNVINLFKCDKDGKYTRRLGFDQANTYYPSVLSDGKVMYLRWGYSDKTRWHTFDLFTMNQDGTQQEGLYGNNSCFPPLIGFPQEVPNSQKITAILCGKEDVMQGPLVEINVALAEDGMEGITPIAHNKALPEYCGQGYQPDVEVYFSDPYPLDDFAFITSLKDHKDGTEERKDKNGQKMGLYLFTRDGRRELLAYDSVDNCVDGTPIISRPTPPVLPFRANYGTDKASLSVLDVYFGRGLKDVPRGTVKKLRVVELDYRPKTLGRGNLANASIHSTVSVMGGSWDIKRILGEIPVEEDGSAAFIVPAKTPIYMQAIDENGEVVQSMREWVTLMPGESGSCSGCHEERLTVAPPKQPIAAEPKPLEDFYGEARGFSFVKEIQPILNEHCITCHNGTPYEGKDIKDLTDKTFFIEPREWTMGYLNLTNYFESNCLDDNKDPFDRLGICNDGHMYFEEDALITYYGYDDTVPVLPPYDRGSAKSRLVTMLENKHNDVELSEKELNLIRAWIDLAIPYPGEHTEGVPSDHKNMNRFLQAASARESWEAQEERNIQAWIKSGGTAVSRAFEGNDQRNTTDAGLPYTGNNAITISANPSGIIVRFSDGASPAGMRQVTVYDLTGKKIIRKSFAGQTLAIPLSGIGSGVYTVEVDGVRQLVVNR